MKLADFGDPLLVLAVVVISIVIGETIFQVWLKK